MSIEIEEGGEAVVGVGPTLGSVWLKVEEEGEEEGEVEREVEREEEVVATEQEVVAAAEEEVVEVASKTEVEGVVAAEESESEMEAQTEECGHSDAAKEPTEAPSSGEASFGGTDDDEAALESLDESLYEESIEPVETLTMHMEDVAEVILGAIDQSNREPADNAEPSSTTSATAASPSSSPSASPSSYSKVVESIVSVAGRLVAHTLHLVALTSQSELASCVWRNGADATRALFTFLHAVLKRAVEVAIASALWALLSSATVLQKLAPKVVEAAPIVAAEVWALCTTRPELLAAAISAGAALYVLVCVRRWMGRLRDERSARSAAQVDAAARWVLAELHAHQHRWRSVSGSALPLPPTELRTRVPHSVLADRSLWPRVAHRVRADENVSVTGGGSTGVQESWLYASSGDAALISR
jgi:hypothetical protein